MKARRRRRRRVRWRLLFVVLLLLAGGGVWLTWAIRSRPTWYQPPDRTSEQVVELGHTTQNRVITQVHKVRQQEPTWTLRLTADEMNAWLAVNLPGWIEHETGRTWPDEVTLPMVQVEPEGLTVGVQIPERFDDSVLSVRILPQHVEEEDEEGAAEEAWDDDGDGGISDATPPAAEGESAAAMSSEGGESDAPPQSPREHASTQEQGADEHDAAALQPRQVTLHVNRVAINRLSLPEPIAERTVGVIRSMLAGDVSDSEFDRVIQILLGERAVDPVIELSDGRCVRILDFQFEDGAVTLTCMTETGGGGGRRGFLRTIGREG